MQLLTDEPKSQRPEALLRRGAAHARPEALVEAVQILNAHRDEVVVVMMRHGYTDPSTIGGYLDRDLPNSLIDGKLSDANREDGERSRGRRRTIAQ